MLRMTSVDSPARARSSSATRRGLNQPLHPSVTGSIVGLVGGSLFMLANRGALPGPWPMLALVAWVVLAAATVWAVFLARRGLSELPAPHPRAGMVYGLAMLGMVALFLLSRPLSLLLSQVAGQDPTAIQPALIVLAVGAHFLPFARVFHAPVFGRLGAALCLLALAGAGLAAIFGAPWGSATAVAAGAVMLGALVIAALRPRR